MKKQLKHLMVAAAAVMLFSAQALACGGKQCASESCDFKGAKAENCAKGYAKGSGYKKSAHHKIPGNSPAYIRKILKKADAIGLTDKQRKQVGELLVAAETGAAKAHAEAQIEVAEFRGKLHGGSLNDSDIKAYAKRMGELRAAKYEANLMASVKASRLLNDEQKSKLYAGKKTMGANK
ncbi:LTXXQ motif family protein [Mariprofundus aestuarium]|uniref:LTXXQ motif family protein n=1 Tax=Mariprofundus aestuarium TaxID=1921086 RepID=A0A2K8KWQ1_MARES|nr:Spy/CpxP family protein refolding chaperone [Mariprofundus aestuarium]ATX79253.1 LTXXQ motif family protein [Mariprofundus aestuarium]